MSKKWDKKRIRRLNVATHRDLGYFFSALIIIYCISGIALNHINDWNSDFIIFKKHITLKKQSAKEDVTDKFIQSFGSQVGEEKFKVYDFPTSDQVKIYYDDATLHLNFSTKTGIYERVTKRPFFYETNVIHRNSLVGWKWVSDIFGILLIVITVTGMFVLKGKHGITGRGKWLIAAGFIPPIIAVILQAIL